MIQGLLVSNLCHVFEDEMNTASLAKLGLDLFKENYKFFECVFPGRNQYPYIREPAVSMLLSPATSPINPSGVASPPLVSATSTHLLPPSYDPLSSPDATRASALDTNSPAYFQIDFNSVVEARLRIALLFLFTYDPRPYRVLITTLLINQFNL